MDRKISIITVCYNDLEALKITSLSITNQHSLNIEWIVIDGGSTDGTTEYLKKNERIYKYISESDSGIYDAMNKGTTLATGNYVIYLNAGDSFFNSESLQNCINKTENFDLILCGAFFLYTNNKSRYRAPRPLNAIWHSIPANHQAIIFRQDILGSSPYDTSYKICGDYHLLARLSIKNVSSLVLDIPLVSFAVGGISTFEISNLSIEAMRVQKQVLSLNRFLIRVSWFRRKIAMYLNLLLLKVNANLK